MKKLHNKLLQHSRHYRTWHERPYHQHHHWLVAFLALLIGAYAIAGAWQATLNEADQLSMSLLVPQVQAQGPIPAFPGCEGFGCETPGGRGGKVVFVTNLNDSGPGSLREALMMIEPRIIVFKVSGTIYGSEIELSAENSYVTVAGQTAPGDGITLAVVAFNLRNGFHDGVFRYLRIRTPSTGYNGLTVLYGSNNIVLDHCSISWAIDEGLDMWGAQKTLQFSGVLLVQAAWWVMRRECIITESS